MKLIAVRFLFFGLLVFAGCHPSRRVGELVGVTEVKSIEDSSWNLIEVDGKSAYPPTGKKYFIQFNKTDKSISAFAGCNKISGTYAQTGKELHLTLISTRMACLGAMETEAAFLRALDAVNEYTINDNELQLRNGTTTVARFLHATNASN